MSSKVAKKQTAQKQPTAREKLDAFGMDAICEMIIDVTPTRTIAAQIGVSWDTLDKYVSATPERAEQYARARLAQADKMADDIMQIVDEPPALTASGSVDSGDVANRRLRMDARRWLAGKMAPKRYGDKVLNEHTGQDGNPIEQNMTISFVSPK